MKRIVSGILLVMLFPFILLAMFGVRGVAAESFAGVWARTYGGTENDEAYSMIQTVDGGYAIAGQTLSYGAGCDFWLVKTDANGNAQWNKAYGGTSWDGADCLVQTADGGYAMVGVTTSYGVGTYNFWLVKTDANGNAQWNKAYGGTSTQYAYSLVQTSDGGYAMAGYTYSYGGAWLVKTDASGNEQWNKTYGNGWGWACSLVHTSDGGYALAGYTNGDFWLVKTDAAGNEQWNKTYGGTSTDEARSLVQTVDGGYAIAGTTWSYGAGKSDFWLVKTDAAGNEQWNKTYGGTLYDEARSVAQTGDGEYAIAGWTSSYGAGNYDFWLVKTDANGNAQGNYTYGGTDMDYAFSVVQTNDGRYAIAGYTKSYGAGKNDFWLVKTDEPIPEFPSSAILVTLMVTVTSVAVLVKRKRWAIHVLDRGTQARAHIIDG